MIATLILICAILFIVIIVFIVAIEVFDAKGLAGPICMFSLIVSLILFIIVDNKSIQPIDVYRGNTTLKIAYVDSIPVDTTVVWKKRL